MGGAYLPIAEHGVIGDLHTIALVGTDGTIDWFCAPRFDSPSVFGSILDAEKGGYFRISPVAERWESKQLYFPETAILITRFLTPDGVGEVEDFMTIAEAGGDVHPHQLVRRATCVRGQMRLSVEVAPRFDYGREEHRVRVHDHGVVFLAPSLALYLAGSVPFDLRGRDAHADLTLNAGESVTLVLGQCGRNDVPPEFTEDETGRALETTGDFWRSWLGQSRYRGRWREGVHRSALTLKLLTFRPSGALIAAPTTSLPEVLGGGRNWDYRYTWIRDAAFSLYALLRLGFKDEAAAFMSWLTDRFRESKGGGEGPLQIMYGIDGRTELPEETLDHLEGYMGSSPVRIGNGAATQLQLDIYGELIDSVYLYNKYGRPIYHEAWEDLRRIVEWLCENWDRPDEGIWETRGGQKDFTYSRLMSWVSFDRALRIGDARGLPTSLVKWTEVRDQIYRQIMERGWNEKRGAFVQHYGSEVLDASLLLMPLVLFIAPTDPRWLSTLDAMSNELVSDSLVYRYNVEASPDGLEGAEGTFSICSFWYVEALARAGRLDDARLAFEKMLTYANHVGLYSEEIGPSGELLGNFPQAFTHLALISAAVNLDRLLG
jgi:GH15 family glucan-1,4-alpha-glucosidase